MGKFISMLDVKFQVIHIHITYNLIPILSSALTKKFPNGKFYNESVETI